MTARITDGPPTLGSALGIALRAYAPDSWYRLRFEGLVADPAGQLRGVCGFLGEEYAPGVTEPHRVAGMAVPARRTWHRRTHGALDIDRAGTWTIGLTPNQIRLSGAVLGERLTSHGYELAGAVRPDPAELLRYRRVEVLRRAARAERRTLDRLARMREPGPVACRPATG
ncbi:hypothetical protein [Streptomyces mirabilis]|uniref:hypothetical protein n=1 Tax=Streptomyces mirabilis TaxID=68239 RepID=UPI00364E56A0